jgi:hypothetical protein
VPLPILKHSANADFWDPLHCQPLHQAVQRSLAATKLLVDYGANVTVKDWEERGEAIHPMTLDREQQVQQHDGRQ